jgi:hypothetical protein
MCLVSFLKRLIDKPIALASLSPDEHIRIVAKTMSEAICIFVGEFR